MPKNNKMQHNPFNITDFIKSALYEDIREGDHTSLACIPQDLNGRARLLVKEPCVLAGVELAEMIFKVIDPQSVIEVIKKDGEWANVGDVAFYINSKSALILQAERLVLNAMQRMSGIATMTQQYMKAVEGTGVKLLDTRKTTPLFRYFEKWAVRIGGGTNYRDGLYDRIMIKDNHADFCGGHKMALDSVHLYLKEHNLNLEITVECRNQTELTELLNCGGFQRIMLDNHTPENLKKAVELIAGRYETEASGGINLNTIRAYAETGVDFISVGALTHGAKSIDLSLKSVK